MTDLCSLNLTAANNVFLMEPQWNPILEDQALDRVYKIGQTKEVNTVRYIVKDTLEEVSYGELRLHFTRNDLYKEHSTSTIKKAKSRGARICAGQKPGSLDGGQPQSTNSGKAATDFRPSYCKLC